MNPRSRHGMDPRSVRCDPGGDTFFAITPGGDCQRRLTRNEIIERADSDAQERVNRLRIANSTGSVKRQMGVQRTEEERVLALAAERQAIAGFTARESCRRCGVRSDQHQVHGCKRWAPE